MTNDHDHMTWVAISDKADMAILQHAQNLNQAVRMAHAWYIEKYYPKPPAALEVRYVALVCVNEQTMADIIERRTWAGELVHRRDRRVIEISIEPDHDHDHTDRTDHTVHDPAEGPLIV